jgi:hypothetical protein
MVDVLAAHGALIEERQLAQAVGGHEHGKRPADTLLGGVAVQAFGRGIPGRDEPAERNRHDRIVRGIDDRSREHALFLTQLALGDVEEGDDDAVDDMSIVR